MKDWGLLGRYDNFKLDDQTEDNAERKRTIVGIAYQYNKNVEFIANYLNENKDDDTKTDALMLTAEVNW
jgi:phosphate-selective porin